MRGSSVISSNREELLRAVSVGLFTNTLCLASGILHLQKKWC